MDGLNEKTGNINWTEKRKKRFLELVSKVALNNPPLNEQEIIEYKELQAIRRGANPVSMIEKAAIRKHNEKVRILVDQLKAARGNK